MTGHRVGAIAAAAVSLALASCGGPQSSLVAAGREAHMVATLGTVLWIGAAAIFALVVLATAFAILGAPPVRSRLADERTITAAGIAFPVVVLTLLLVWSFTIMAGVRATEGPAATRIEIVGERWWWRVTYRAADGSLVAAGANEIVLPRGQPVDLVLSSADVIHSFWVPSLAGKLDMIPGRETILRVTATELGFYRGQCAEYCGGAHALMALWAIVVAPEEFRARLQHEASDASVPTQPAPSDGRSLFEASGCGACHAVRGSPAQGVIGPDLTHVGSRRSIGAATLPMSREALASWIVDSHAVKPEVRMPRFGTLTRTEVGGIAAYLEGLK